MIYQSDNPYYFNSELPAHLMQPSAQQQTQAATAATATSSKPSGGGRGFSFFRRRSSSSSSGCTASRAGHNNNNHVVLSAGPATMGRQSPATKVFNSATLGAEAAILGSRRSSLTALFRSQPVAPAQHPAMQPAVAYHAGGGPASLPMYADSRQYPHQRIGFQMHLQQQQHQLHQMQQHQPHQQHEPHHHQMLRKQHRTRHESYGDCDDVFVQQNGPTSLNGMHSLHYPQESTNLRRHSIGTAVRNGERQRCGSMSDEVPKSYAPRPPMSASSSPSSSRPHHHSQPHHHQHRSHRRQTAHQSQSPSGGYCFNSNGAGVGSNSHHDDMDDILIVMARQSEAAICWAQYLNQRFDKITKQRGRKPFNFLHIKIDTDAPIAADLTRRSLTTKLQIVVLCPALCAVAPPHLRAQLAACLRPDLVLGILLGVPEERAAAMHRHALPAYRRWRTVAVPQPLAASGASQHQSVLGSPQTAQQHHKQQLLHAEHTEQQQQHMSKVLGIATDILGRALCQRPHCNSALSPSADKHITMAAAPAAAAAASHNHSTATTGSSEAFTVLPRKVKIGQSKLVALLSEPLAREDAVRVLIERSGEPTLEAAGVKRRNPYTLQFSVPDTCMEVSTMIDVRIERNGRTVGRRPVKCESRLRELEQLLRAQDQPLEFMRQALGLNVGDGRTLDAQMVQAFQRNMPAGFHLLAVAGQADEGKTPSVRPFGARSAAAAAATTEEFPTLLHFAARWGLEQLAVLLLECPGGEQACDMRNVAGRTPAELAEAAGHAKLAASLKSFAQMHELSTMYHYFKGISNAAGNEENSNATVQLTASVSIRKPRQSNEIVETEEYMEMNPDLTEADDSGSINAVTNLNYINIDSIKDEEIARNLNDTADTSASLSSSSVQCNELRIQEPAYEDSSAQAPPAPPMRQPTTTTTADAFSQDCLNVLESCTGAESRSASSMSTQSVASASKCTAAAAAASSDYMLHPSNIPVLPDRSTSAAASLPVLPAAAAADFGDYLMQPSNRPVTTYAIDTPTSPTPHPTAPPPLDRQESTTSSKQSSGSSTSSTTANNVDEELLEIMNDFKNNVFTIGEVEALVDSWKARNDVRQSFKDKQAQLARMRDEYERVQATVREKMRHRPTPFERMRKLFGRSKQPPAEANAAAAAASTAAGSAAAMRPRSSLSLQSLSSSASSTASGASSSGRLSTGSACSGTSLGDSGTHSDPDERRTATATATASTSSTLSTSNAVNGSCHLGSPGSLMATSTPTTPSAADDYMMPPAPRPVNGGAPQKPTTLRLRSSDSCGGGGDSEQNYTMFPSNVPVLMTPTTPTSAHSSMQSLVSPTGLGHQQQHHDYMNFSGLNTIVEMREGGGCGAAGVIGSDVQTIKVRTPEEIYGTTTMGGMSQASSSCTLNASGGSASKRPSIGDLCSSFKPLAPTSSSPATPSGATSTTTSATVLAISEQSVRFQKGSLDGGLERTRTSVDPCAQQPKTATVHKPAVGKMKLCKSSSSPSVVGAMAFSTVSVDERNLQPAAAASTEQQHDYMNV